MWGRIIILAYLVTFCFFPLLITESVAQDTTPEPYPIITIDTIAYDDHANIFLVSLLINNQELIPQFRIKVEDHNGRLIDEYYRDNSARFELSTNNLQRGEEYQLTVTIYERSGIPKQFRVEQNYGGQIQTFIESQRSFVYPTVEEPLVEIITVSHNTTTHTLLLTLNTRHIESLSHYMIWLEDESNNQIVTNQMRFPITPTSNTIEIMLDPKTNTALISGRYRISLEGYDNNNLVLLRTSYETSLIFPQETIWNRLRQNSIALGIIGGIIVIFLLIIIKESFLSRRDPMDMIQSSPKKQAANNLLSMEDRMDETLSITKHRHMNNAIATLNLVENTGQDTVSQLSIPITSHIFKIGRGQGDYFKQCYLVSNKHAIIFYEDNHFFIRDLESKNLTFVNGTALTPLANYEIKDGDKISITQHLIFKFKC